jgi:hypothetical protein
MINSNPLGMASDKELQNPVLATAIVIIYSFGPTAPFHTLAGL